MPQKQFCRSGSISGDDSEHIAMIVKRLDCFSYTGEFHFLQPVSNAETLVVEYIPYGFPDSPWIHMIAESDPEKTDCCKKRLVMTEYDTIRIGPAIAIDSDCMAEILHALMPAIFRHAGFPEPFLDGIGQNRTPHLSVAEEGAVLVQDDASDSVHIYSICKKRGFDYTGHMNRTSRILSLSRSLSSELETHHWAFGGIVCNPLSYAWENYERFIRMSVREGQKLMFLGMNPGPYGMMQTGVPFGEVDAVRNYLGIDGEVGEPAVNPPLKKVVGMSVRQHEVSGRKFWGMAAAYGCAEDFFSEAFVWSFCPLAFIDGRRNVTPDELPAADRDYIDSVCGKYLSEMLAVVDVPIHAALGRYAEKRLLRAGIKDVIYFPHPSPRSHASMGFWDSGEAISLFRRLVSEA